MNGIESELFDLEESLMRNDGMADDSTYSTIVGIANEVSELELENAKLRELIDDITEVVEFSDPALVQFIAKRMERIGTEVGR